MRLGRKRLRVRLVTHLTDRIVWLVAFHAALSSILRDYVPGSLADVGDAFFAEIPRDAALLADEALRQWGARR